MSSNHEIPIPKSRGEAIILFVFSVVVVLFILIGVVNLCYGVALIASSIWLAMIACCIWASVSNAGGMHRFLISLLGDLFGRHFVESDPADGQPGGIRFGFKLLGHRFIQKRILPDKIESVKWNTGQATAMAGHDMNDWHVWVWFDHDDPTKNEMQRKSQTRKPDQDLYGVGPSARKDRTEALGLSLVAFLRDAGADLIHGTTTTCFVRRRRDGGEVNCT